MYYIPVRISVRITEKQENNDVQGVFQPLGIFTDKVLAEKICLIDKEKVQKMLQEKGVGCAWDISEIEKLNDPIKL